MFSRKKFPFYKQLDIMDCGPTCLKMIAKYHGKEFNLEQIRSASHITKQGITFLGIGNAAESIGLKQVPISVDFETFKNEVPLPCIAHWDQAHFVVIYEVSDKSVTIGDPAFGIVKREKQKFIQGWANSLEDNLRKGYLMILEPTPEFYEKQETHSNREGFWALLPYFKPYRKELIQLIIGLAFGSVLQLIFPFLTQAVVDYGINYKEINFVYLLLLAQIVLFASRSSVELIRGWILLYLTRKVNISLISDFLIRLMSLPIAYFDSKHTGDIIQRINDNKKVQDFLSTSSLSTVFGLFTILIFAIVLAYYSGLIFLIFLLGSALFIWWSLRFMKRRAEIDYETFMANISNQNTLIQLLTSIEDIKLNGSQQKRRWEWEDIQIKLFEVSTKGLALLQKQTAGGKAINELKNIFITFISAKLVISGEITLGAMLAIQYILGQLELPLNNVVQFLQKSQDASLSLVRLQEINQVEPEELLTQKGKNFEVTKFEIDIKDLSFRYGSPRSPLVLKDINLTINNGQTTAIVGASGSGKTTLLKLLLKFYQNYQGTITVSGIDLKELPVSVWRNYCGAVLQEGQIFNDTLLSNISESEKDTQPDLDKVWRSIEIANLKEMVENLPNGIDTQIGKSGVVLSTGQKQRVIIARTVYKDSQILMFDEATSALDANNEKTIMQNFKQFTKNKTVIVVAHRLSTVVNADKIIVLDRGEIVEQGTHAELIRNKGKYYVLVRNQLALDT